MPNATKRRATLDCIEGSKPGAFLFHNSPRTSTMSQNLILAVTTQTTRKTRPRAGCALENFPKRVNVTRLTRLTLTRTFPLQRTLRQPATPLTKMRKWTMKTKRGMKTNFSTRPMGMPTGEPGSRIRSVFHLMSILMSMLQSRQMMSLSLMQLVKRRK